MDNNLKLRLMELLNTSSGKAAKDQLKSMDMSQIEGKLMNVDKNQIVNKLESMNLSPLANKLKNMSQEEIVRALRNNPAFLDMLDKL